jgi:hypothetical protein
MIVPGSGLVKEQAEAEGLHKIFLKAGFEWREPGCSMCLAMNPDKLAPGERCASTSNRNFEGRQGYKGRTHLSADHGGGGGRPLRRHQAWAEAAGRRRLTRTMHERRLRGRPSHGQQGYAPTAWMAVVVAARSRRRLVQSAEQASCRLRQRGKSCGRDVAARR